MGNWNVSIEGIGCHDNGRANIDVDLAAKEFVAKLKAMGHSIRHATITVGGAKELDEKPEDAK